MRRTKVIESGETLAEKLLLFQSESLVCLVAFLNVCVLTSLNLELEQHALCDVIG